jgi:hypothetical protein
VKLSEVEVKTPTEPHKPEGSENVVTWALCIYKQEEMGLSEKVGQAETKNAGVP